MKKNSKGMSWALIAVIIICIIMLVVAVILITGGFGFLDASAISLNDWLKIKAP